MVIGREPPVQEMTTTLETNPEVSSKSEESQRPSFLLHLTMPLTQHPPHWLHPCCLHFPCLADHPPPFAKTASNLLLQEEGPDPRKDFVLAQIPHIQCRRAMKPEEVPAPTERTSDCGSLGE